MFALGKKIRKRYSLFLDELYTPDILEATSSYVSRSKTSMQLFLYGLFPLPEKYRFDPNIDLQPIPYNEISSKFDEFFIPAVNCPKFKEALERYIKSAEYIEKELKDRTVLKHIEKNTRTKMRSYFDIFEINSILKCEKDWGLVLPAWTKDLYPNKLDELQFKGYELMTANLALRKLSAGRFVKKIIDDSLAKIDQLSLKKKKLAAYSGHGITLGNLLGALKMLSLDNIPDYAAHFIIELHYVNSTFGFKVIVKIRL